jgi:hypothetical protein
MRRYLITFAVSAGSTLLVAFALSWWFEPIEGDLTRIGKYSERDFGWNAQQPVVEVRPNGARVQAPAVMVLGDSFSAGNVWQSVLAVQSGLTTQSFNYSQNGCIGAWAVLAARDAQSKTVVIESVERAFVSRFRDVSSCSSDGITPWESAGGTTAPQRVTWPVQLHIQHSFQVAAQAVQMWSAGVDGILRGKVVNVPMDPLCGNFSHRTPHRFLYFGEDEEKWQWTSEEVERAVANVAMLQRMVEKLGKRFVFLVVPDKSSVYRECLTLPADIHGVVPVNVTQKLIENGVHAPDALGSLQQRIRTEVDLYNPDNTHFGTRGYQALAHIVLTYIDGK